MRRGYDFVICRQRLIGRDYGTVVASQPDENAKAP
jgi:hypothetical protein